MTADGSITFVDQTGSTNADLVAALKSAKSPREGDWLIARRQVAGRGRQGREWFDGSGNFMGSTVVAIHRSDPPPSSLGFVAALAVARTLDEELEGAAAVQLKWPNDVLIEGGKAAGLLLEMVDRTVVIGMGVNLARAPKIPGRQTACVAEHIRKAPEAEEFASHIASHFAKMLAWWRSGGLGPVLEAFLARSIHAVGSAVSVHDTDGSRVSGTFAGLEPLDGALRLRLADGSCRVIRAGDLD
ncbi:MAG: biotin--[acetyl-CoA-carboxylase] ligase [Erythrobacter sp.]